MLASEARPGDVVLSEDDGQYYLAPVDAVSPWSVMQPLPYYGPPGATAPDGELVLIGRERKPACGH